MRSMAFLFFPGGAAFRFFPGGAIPFPAGRSAFPVVAILGALAAAGCQGPNYDRALEQIHNQDRVIAAQREKNEDLRSKLAAAETARAVAQADAERLRGSDAGYRAAREKLEQRLKDLEASFPAGGDGITVEPAAGGGYKFVVQGEVLFGSGEAELTEDGKAALKKVADALKDRKEWVRVEGHTDNRPVSRPETQKRHPLGNLDLSLDRALHVADFLIRSGVEAARVSAAGHGEHRPRADNGTDDGRRRNRRVEILVSTEP